MATPLTKTTARVGQLGTSSWRIIDVAKTYVEVGGANGRYGSKFAGRKYRYTWDGRGYKRGDRYLADDGSTIDEYDMPEPEGPTKSEIGEVKYRLETLLRRSITDAEAKRAIEDYRDAGSPSLVSVPAPPRERAYYKTSNPRARVVRVPGQTDYARVAKRRGTGVNELVREIMELGRVPYRDKGLAAVSGKPRVMSSTEVVFKSGETYYRITVSDQDYKVSRIDRPDAALIKIWSSRPTVDYADVAMALEPRQVTSKGGALGRPDEARRLKALLGRISGDAELGALKGWPAKELRARSYESALADVPEQTRGKYQWHRYRVRIPDDRSGYAARIHGQLIQVASTAFGGGWVILVDDKRTGNLEKTLAPALARAETIIAKIEPKAKAAKKKPSKRSRRRGPSGITADQRRRAAELSGKDPCPEAIYAITPEPEDHDEVRVRAVAFRDARLAYEALEKFEKYAVGMRKKWPGPKAASALSMNVRSEQESEGARPLIRGAARKAYDARLLELVKPWAVAPKTAAQTLDRCVREVVTGSGRARVKAAETLAMFAAQPKPKRAEVAKPRSAERPRRLTAKEVRAKPWLYSPDTFQAVIGVKQPWLAEISPVQFGRMSKRAKVEYDRKREAEWAASAEAKAEWRRLVIDAHNRGAWSKSTPNVSREAKSELFAAKVRADEQKAAASLEQARKKNSLRISDLSPGMRVHYIMGNHYGTVSKVSKKSARMIPEVEYLRGKPMLIREPGINYLGNSDLEAVVARGGPFPWDVDKAPRKTARKPSGTTCKTAASTLGKCRKGALSLREQVAAEVNAGADTIEKLLKAPRLKSRQRGAIKRTVTTLKKRGEVLESAGQLTTTLNGSLSARAEAREPCRVAAKNLGSKKCRKPRKRANLAARNKAARKKIEAERRRIEALKGRV